jgi:hypothetical protein
MFFMVSILPRLCFGVVQTGTVSCPNSLFASSKPGCDSDFFILNPPALADGFHNRTAEQNTCFRSRWTTEWTDSGPVFWGEGEVRAWHG